MRSLAAILIIGVLIASTFESKAQYREDLAGDPPSVSKSIHIYPNPTNESSDFVNVRIAPLNSHKVKLVLHNIIGNEITTDTEVVDEHELRFRVKDLASGYYLLTVRDSETNFRATYKFLKR